MLSGIIQSSSASSTKTRIETRILPPSRVRVTVRAPVPQKQGLKPAGFTFVVVLCQVRAPVPQKQGLKLRGGNRCSPTSVGSSASSTKTRIETWRRNGSRWEGPSSSASSTKTRIETPIWRHDWRPDQCSSASSTKTRIETLVGSERTKREVRSSASSTKTRIETRNKFGGKNYA